jgi:hypothetical protein
MNPFSKYIGIAAAIAALLAPGGAFFGLIPGKYAGIISAICAVIAALSHSVTGTNGEVK